jgi:hypothetical protein
MKRILIFFAITSMVLACTENVATDVEISKTLSNAKVEEILTSESPDTTLLSKLLVYVPITPHIRDSLNNLEPRTGRMLSSIASDKIYGSNPEYSDGTGLIHLKVFYVTSDNSADIQELSVSVGDDYAMVGGGAWAHDYTGNGAFLTKSMPLNSTTWIGKSKAHIISDPHYLTVYAIGMRFENVDPSYLRSKIHITSYQSPTNSNTPTASVSIPSGCLLVGGGAYDNYNGYGNILISSKPNLNEWYVAGQAYRRSDPSRITAYAIGIEDISYPTVGYIQVAVNQTQVGVQNGEGDCYATAPTGYALTCPGGYTISHTYGRLLVGLFPLEPDAQVVSKDTPGFFDYGAVGAYAIAIQKRPY